MEAESDAILVDRCLRGDGTAYAELVRTHTRRVFAACLAITGNAADAEDMAQETFMRGYAKLDTLRKPQRFGSWIVAIAANLSRELARSRAIRDRFAATADCEEPTAAGFTDPERFSNLRRGLDWLPESYRVPLLLYYFDDQSSESIAAALGVSVGAVHARLCRARHELRAILEKMEAGDERRM